MYVLTYKLRFMHVPCALLSYAGLIQMHSKSAGSSSDQTMNWLGYQDIFKLWIYWIEMIYILFYFLLSSTSMHSSAKFQASPISVVFLCSCDKVYHKKEVCFLLYLLGRNVTWQNNPNLLYYNWPCTVIYDHDWQLLNCPLGHMSAVSPWIHGFTSTSLYSTSEYFFTWSRHCQVSRIKHEER